MSQILEVKAMGGLANRMRAIASAYALASDCGMGLKVIWYPLPELNASFANLFKTDDLPFELLHCNGAEFWLKYSEPRRKNLFLSKIYQAFHYDLYLTDCDGSTIKCRNNKEALVDAVKLAKHPIISSGLVFYEHQDGLYSKLFVPNDFVQSQIDEITKRFDENTVGVHIRRTDNKQSIMHSPLELFVEKMKRLIDENQNTTFYVASDDAETKRKLQSIFGDRIFVADVKVDRNDRNAIIQAVAEMYALSKTRMIIGSYYSSFSEIAAKIGSVPVEQLYK